MYARDDFYDGLSAYDCADDEHDRWVEAVKDEYEIYLLDFPCKGECSDECKHQSFQDYLARIEEEYETYVDVLDEELYYA